MKVRPIFWYLLTAALVLGLLMGGMRHMAAIAGERQEALALADLQNPPLSTIMSAPTNTVDFLAELTAMAQKAPAVSLAKFTTESMPSGGYCCQVTANGAYNALTEFLSQLEASKSVQVMQDFALTAAAEGDMTLTVEVVINLRV